MFDELPKAMIGDEELAICPHCIEIDDFPLQPNFQNVGFDENPHYEPQGLICPNCKRNYD